MAMDAAAAATLLDAARRYESEASRRQNDAQTNVTRAKDDVLSAMEILKQAHEKLAQCEAVAAEAEQSCKAAQDYRNKWEAQLNPNWKKSAFSSDSQNEDDQKHVSFAPQHEDLAGSVSVTSSSGQRKKVRRKRIRVAEHGWGVYEGLLDSLGEPHGRGTVTWENGGHYEGDWADGKANGHGIMQYGNGDRYEGGWKDGCRFGQGTHHFKDGGVYEGQWSNAAPHGLGKMTLKNGSHYEGYWKDGKWHGNGIVRPVNGGEWEGTFHMGKCTVGTLRRPNGELEIGRYDSVNPDDVKNGVWWSIDRTQIWVIEDGQKKEQIDEAGAASIVQNIGVALPDELREVAMPIKSEDR